MEETLILSVTFENIPRENNQEQIIDIDRDVKHLKCEGKSKRRCHTVCFMLVGGRASAEFCPEVSEDMGKPHP